ncbi:MAG: hypothetical protein ABL982_12895 [Vicinamibacterales bacterium]
MNTRQDPTDNSFDRLQRLLLAMRHGDELVSREASRLTGLTEPTCRTILERLVHAGFMAQADTDRFVRVSLA